MFEGTINIKWLLQLLLQLGAGAAIVATQDDPSLRNLGVALIGAGLGQAGSANSTVIRHE